MNYSNPLSGYDWKGLEQYWRSIANETADGISQTADITNADRTT